MIDIVNEKLNVNRLISEKKQVIFVESDMIVPDSKPDVLNIINSSGVVSIYKKEVLDDKIRVDGCINGYIMYTPGSNEEFVRGINTNIDFSEFVNVSNINKDMNIIIQSKIKSIDANVVNERKVTIKSAIELYIKIYINEEFDVINDVTNDDNSLQFLKESIKINSLIGSGKTKINCKENIKIDNTDNLAEVLSVNINNVDKDVKNSYNKILVKSDIEIKLIYLTEDNRISIVNSKIPAVGFIDIQGVNDNNMSDIYYQIKNIIIKPNSQEDHSIYVELELEVICEVFEEKQVELINDMYSISSNILLEKRNINTVLNKKMLETNKELREKINISDIEKMKLVNVDLSYNILNVNKIQSKILYEIEMNLKFMFIDEYKKIFFKEAKIPFDYVISDLENGENVASNCNIEIINSDFLIEDNGNVNCNIDLKINDSIYETRNIDIIEKITEEEMKSDEDYSIIIYIVKKGDTLWNIAKMFGSTIDGIVRVNGLENDNKIYPGQKLYIPKFEKISESSYE